MFDKIKSVIEKAIENRIFPGCCVGIIAGEKKWCGAFGRLTYNKEDEPVSEKTVYDLASITKSIPTALLALKLIEEGKIGLNDPVNNTIPEMCGNYSNLITVKHLLTHTIDFGFKLSTFKNLPPDKIMEKIFSASLRNEPGKVFSYSNATSILLGLMVERVIKISLDEAAESFLFGPLGMSDTTFFPKKFPYSQIAPTEEDPWRGRIIRGEVHDESAWALRPKIVGSAGLFSTVQDLLKVCSMILNNGKTETKHYFLPETISTMHTNAIDSQIGYTALGWELNQPSFMGKKCNRNTFGKTGFTGCSLVIDPLRKAAVIILSNHTFPRRGCDRSLINEIRSSVADILFESIDENDKKKCIFTSQT